MDGKPRNLLEKTSDYIRHLLLRKPYEELWTERWRRQTLAAVKAGKKYEPLDPNFNEKYAESEGRWAEARALAKVREANEAALAHLQQLDRDKAKGKVHKLSEAELRKQRKAIAGRG